MPLLQLSNRVNPPLSKLTQRRLRLAWVGLETPAPPALGHEVSAFEDSDDFLLHPQAFGFDFFIVHLEQRGVRGVDLIRLVRRRSAAGIIALGREDHADYVAALDMGADAVMSPMSPTRHLGAAIAAIQRRAAGAGVPAATGQWTLLEEKSTLQAPDGTHVALSESELIIMRCFADAEDRKVDRPELIACLWGAGAESMDNALHATLYRLRKRIEQRGHLVAPIQSISRVGYAFRAPLARA